MTDNRIGDREYDEVLRARHGGQELQAVSAEDLTTGQRIVADDGTIWTVEYVVAALHPDDCKVAVIDAGGYRYAKTVPRRRSYEVTL